MASCLHVRRKTHSTEDKSCLCSTPLRWMMYYMRMGMCKFGASCKYHHPRHGGESPSLVILNIYGYPLRPNEKECSHYMKTGQYKFGITCKFHHPLPAAEQYGMVTGNLPVIRPALLPVSYIPDTYGPMLFPPGMVPVLDWTPYLVFILVLLVQCHPKLLSMQLEQVQFYGHTQLSASAPAYAGPYVSLTAKMNSAARSHSTR
ncbi:hypothetical protein RDI58_015422 [Solanum bulbocastanum]|uniref:C3H1-type domain-containing protein n=1 Tax=Solanum bulbocastanum TaxID=147425 RepID=A0AAN8YBZ1_SOLBU